MVLLSVLLSEEKNGVIQMMKCYLHAHKQPHTGKDVLSWKGLKSHINNPFILQIKKLKLNTENPTTDSY